MVFFLKRKLICFIFLIEGASVCTLYTIFLLHDNKLIKNSFWCLSTKHHNSGRLIAGTTTLHLKNDFLHATMKNTRSKPYQKREIYMYKLTWFWISSSQISSHCATRIDVYHFSEPNCDIMWYIVDQWPWLFCDLSNNHGRI